MTFQKNIFLVFFLFIAHFVSAQGNADPTTWSYEVKKLSEHNYALIFHAELKEGYHIFSQKPGDDFLIPPSFKFKKDAKMVLVGTVTESGKLKTEKMDGMDNPIKYYEDKVDFIQKVKCSKGVTISGEHEYQICSRSMCFPPKKKSFAFIIKD